MDDLEAETLEFCKCGHTLAMHQGTLYECMFSSSPRLSEKCRCKGYEPNPKGKTWYERLADD
jgi:hypothetical protein